MSSAPQAAVSDEPLDFRRILPIFIIIFVDLMGLTIIIPVLPLYATSFGATPFLLGVMQAAYPLMQFIGGPILGSLGDRFGRKPVLLISQIGTFTGFIVMGLANSLGLLLLARAIDGLSGANIATAQAAISDSTPPKRRAQALGIVGAAFGLGFVFGPVISAIALQASNNDFRVPAFIAAAFSLGSIILTSVLFRETLPPERRSTAPLSALSLVTGVFPRMYRALANPAIGILLTLYFFLWAAFGAFQTYVTPLTYSRLGLSGSANAIFFAYVGIILVLVQGRLIGPLARRFGERRLVFTGLGLLALGMALLAFTPTMPLPSYSQQEALAQLEQGDAAPAGEGLAVDVTSALVPPPDDAPRGYLGVGFVLLALTCIPFGNSMLQVSIVSLITKRVDRREVGTVLGLNSAFQSAANTIGPLMAGVLAQAFGLFAPFAASAVLLLVLLGVARARLKAGAEEQAGAATAGPPPVGH